MQMQSQNRLIVVNLIGGPGVGKSQLAHAIMSELKRTNMRVEYVGEFAKDLSYRKDFDTLSDQLFVLANQHARIRALVGQVDVVIMDTSLLLGLLYMPADYPSTFAPFLLDVYNSFNNVVFAISRHPDIEYQSWGRNQTLPEAIAKDNEVVDLLTKMQIPYIPIERGDGDVEAIIGHISHELLAAQSS